MTDTLCKACPLRPVLRRYASVRPDITVEATPDDVIREAARLFDTSEEALVGPSRARRIVPLRQITMYVAHGLGYSYPEVGNAFDRDHTTVMYSVAKVTDHMGDEWWASRLDALTEAVQ